MSLGQRLHNQLEKKFEGQQNDVEQLQTVIRQLKLLSKSQSTLLKAYLQEKLNNASSLVTKASTYLDTKNDSKAQELKNGLKALKLEEIEVDVTSTKVALQEELTKLRIAIENNGSLPAASNGAPPPSSMMTNSLVAGAGSNAKDLKKITDLETENAKLSQQIAELKNDLIVANQASNNNAKTSQQSNVNQEELNRLRQENESLNSKVKDLSVSLEKKSTELSDSETRIADLSRKANDTTKEKTLQSEIDKLRGQLQEEKQSKVTLQKELETRYQQKMYELNGLNEQKLKEKEEEWAAEREEMEVALAQELEEVERVKDEEIQSLQSQITILQKKIKQLQTMNANLFSSLQKVSEKMRSLQRDYKSTFANTKREIQQTMGSIKGEYGGTLVQKIITLGQEMAQINKKYLREMSERKRLHNVVQELKGNIRVYLRCRPPTAKEVETFGNDALCVSFPNPGEIKVFNSEKNREKTWEFDEVFDTNTTQEQVYSDVSALVTSVLDGYNVCIFAYGQTGSGKTHTMSGPPSNPGVNTRALEELFQKTQDRAGEWVDNISVCILEVYNEDIRDLLDDKNDEKLEVKMGEYGNYVPGLTQISVQTMEQVLQLIQKADRVRSSATTNMNEHSSRSHMMLTVTVVSEFLPTKLVTRGKLNLVDLAGSERVNKSGAQGQALKEAQNINKSLFALGDVIAARAQKNAHIPFRNSTLTFLLQDSLSQDSKTLMIVCISPILYNCEETTCSLNFAAKVKTVELGRASKNVQSAGSSTKSTGSVGVGAPSAGKRPGIGK